MKIDKQIPNILTSLNLVCGFIAIVLALDLKTLPIAPWFIFIAAVFDFSDGFAARFFKAYSEFGKQLDSLADMVSFGVAPSVIVYKLLQISLFSFTLSTTTNLMIIVFASMIAVFSAIRLAKFNIDVRQSTSFIGLPTPASAILIASSCLTFFMTDSIMLQYLIANQYTLGILIIVDSILMVSELPMFSLKMTSFSFSAHKTQFSFLALAILMLVVFKFSALPLIILLYILMSAVLFAFRKRAGVKA